MKQTQIVVFRAGHLQPLLFKPENSQLIPMLFNTEAKPNYWDICPAERGDIGLVELLVPRATRYDLGMSFRLAARRGDPELFRSIIKFGVTHTRWPPDKDEDHPLHLALLGHHFELA